MPESLKLFRHGIIADASLTSAQPRPVADIPSVEPEVTVAGDDHAEAVGMNPRVVGEIPADAECPLKVFINGEKSSAVYSCPPSFLRREQVFSGSDLMISVSGSSDSSFPMVRRAAS